MKDSDLKNGVGGYVFISHSHKDIEDVRQIRNNLEEQGFEPICFFLKSVTDDNELDALIKREIDARELFVLVDSKNARESKWVKEEMDHIAKTGRKIDRVICLDTNSSLKEEMKRLMDSMRVFISYSSKDCYIAKIVKEELIKRDLKVFLDTDDLLPGDAWADQIANEIETASQRGCCILLISQNSVKSRYALEELSYAIKHNSMIIPVIIGQIELPPQIAHYTAQFQCTHISESPTRQEIRRLTDLVESVLVQKYNNIEEY